MKKLKLSSLYGRMYKGGYVYKNPEIKREKIPLAEWEYADGDSVNYIKADVNATYRLFHTMHYCLFKRIKHWLRRDKMCKHCCLFCKHFAYCWSDFNVV